MAKKKTARLVALGWAKSQLGVKELPAGSNWGPMVKVYLAAAGLKYPAPWCAAFLTWCLEKANYHVTTPVPASVESWEEWGNRHGYLVNRPLRGDIVCYQWDSGWYDHIGIVDRVLSLRWRGRDFIGKVRTVEGNTGVGNDSNGGEVMIRYRDIDRAKFLRLP